jgi:hypothetical protein
MATPQDLPTKVSSFLSNTPRGLVSKRMMDNNADWLKENDIKVKGKLVEKEIEIGGLSAKLLHFDASDKGGDTMVDFAFIPGGDGRLIMLTLWASEEELKANQGDVEAIKKSINAIN